MIMTLKEFVEGKLHVCTFIRIMCNVRLRLRNYCKKGVTIILYLTLCQLQICVTTNHQKIK